MFTGQFHRKCSLTSNVSFVIRDVSEPQRRGDLAKGQEGKKTNCIFESEVTHDTKILKVFLLLSRTYFMYFI